jgi:hypothetical protein
MPPRTRFKPFLSFKFTNPPAHAIQVISEDIGDLLSWNIRATGFDSEGDEKGGMRSPGPA